MAAFAAIINYKKFKKTEVKYFIFFLVYVALEDFLGGYTTFASKYSFLDGLQETIEGTFFEYNYWWFTLFWYIGSTVFFTFYYCKILKNEIFRKIIKYSCVLFLIVSAVIILNDLHAFSSSYIYTINIFGAIIILASVIFYFIEVLNSDKILSIHKSINFVISVAIFIWWLIITPIMFFDVYFSKEDWNFVILRYQVFLFVNFFMYTTFAISLFLLKPLDE